MKKKILLWALAIMLLLGLVPQRAYALTYEQTTSAQPKAIWDYLYAQLGNAYGVAGIMGNMYMESGLKPNNLDNNANRTFGMSDEEYTNAVDNGTYTAFATDKSYYGLNQWGGSRKKKLQNYAKSIDASVGSLTAQLGFVMQELNTSYFSGLKNSIINATSIREASDKWLAIYGGVPNKDEASKAARAARGQVYFDAYAPDSVKNPSEETSADTSSDTSEDTQSDTPAETPSDTPVETPSETPAEQQSEPDPSGGTDTPKDEPAAQKDDAPKTADAGKDSNPDIPKDSGSETVVVLSTDNTLRSLSVSGYKLSPNFKSSVTSYSIEVNYGVTSVSVNAVKNHAKASVSISGGRELSVGNNTIKIVVTAQDGTKRTYTVNVVRREKGLVFDADDSFSGTQQLEDIQPSEAPGTTDIQPGDSTLPGDNETASYPKKGTKEWYLDTASRTWDSIVSQPVPYYVMGAGAAVVVLLAIIIAISIKNKPRKVRSGAEE